ncbi:hypothetical protein [Amycolatopsis aidingensis]|uniref:hypothetical protein n=1 Tax=Amycolatopsis aidingensis TaxID=2842453 RepID=UPI001C0BC37B|nr:hypothetical protein [Amycolatopsis aidingensis]
MTGDATLTALTGGSVLEVESGEIVRADVLVDGERIGAVGAVTGRPGARRVDCTGGCWFPA